MVDPPNLNEAKVDQMKRFLWRQAADGGVRMSYQSFGEAVKVHHRELSPWLHRISTDEMKEGRAALTVLVVASGTEKPLGGFYEMCQEYGRDAGSERATIDQEYTRLLRRRRGVQGAPASGKGLQGAAAIGCLRARPSTGHGIHPSR
jgi:hypothetical protein